jgi:Arc/MetJ family transcription regulator
MFMYIMYMLTNIDLDEELVAAAMQLSGERTKRAVVHRALEQLVRLERLRGLRNVRGTLKWEGDLGVLREERASHGTARRHKRTD